jgi:hypothetical protein
VETGEVAKSRAEQLLNAIENDLTLGWVWCQNAIQYVKALKADANMAHGWLHWGNYLACQREAVMALARMTDGDPQSLSVIKLLNYSEQKPCEFKYATPEEVRQQVAEHRKWLDEHKLFSRARALRDKMLAHTDKVQLSNPAALAALNVNLTETEVCLREIHTVTEVYRGFCNNSSYYLDMITEDVEREMQYELRLRTEMKQYRRAKLDSMRKHSHNPQNPGGETTEER